MTDQPTPATDQQIDAWRKALPTTPMRRLIARIDAEKALRESEAMFHLENEETQRKRIAELEALAADQIRGRLDAERRAAELEAALREIRRRFKAVALGTRDDQDYDLTYLSDAIQDSREVLPDD